MLDLDIFGNQQPSSPPSNLNHFNNDQFDIFNRQDNDDDEANFDEEEEFSSPDQKMQNIKINSVSQKICDEEVKVKSVTQSRYKHSRGVFVQTKSATVIPENSNPIEIYWYSD